MDIILTRVDTAIPVMQLQGKLDGSNYQDLVAAARKLYDAGARDLVLDLSQLTFVSSAGISGLHRVALLFGGKKQAAQEEEGWASYHAIANERGVSQKHVKLLSPTSNVLRSLETVGFNVFFEVHTDLDAALASFQ